MAIDLKYGRVTTEFGTIGEDEPVVVFRARDLVLPRLLGTYSAECAKEGSPVEHLALIADAIVAVTDWQKAHGRQVPRSAGYAASMRFNHVKGD